MKKFLFIAFLLAAVSTAIAQQQKGDMQIQAQAAYIDVAGSGSGTVYLNMSRFVADNIELGATPIVTFSSAVTTLNLSLFGKYSFLTADAKLVPYVGAGVTFIDLTGDYGTTGFTLTGGTRYFITEQVNIDLGANLIFVEGENAFLLLAGLGYIFRW